MLDSQCLFYVSRLYIRCSVIRIDARAITDARLIVATFNGNVPPRCDVSGSKGANDAKGVNNNVFLVTIQVKLLRPRLLRQ